MTDAPTSKPLPGSAGWARACAVALCALVMLAGRARADESAEVPSFAQLEAMNARIGEIRVSARDVFDLDDPREDKRLFRWLNVLHVQTRPDVIRRALLFKSGDPVSVRVLEETERVLRANRYLYDVQLRPVAYHDGVVDVEVITRDTWSLDPGLSAGRSGGSNSSGIQLKEYNLAGTGVSVGIGRSRNVDRSSTEFFLANDRLLGTRAALNYLHADNSDGRRDQFSLIRPFYALDARWTAGVSTTSDEHVDALYQAGSPVSQYRHRQSRSEAFAGWSPGLVDGWVHRYTFGIERRQERYEADALTAPAWLPPDDRQLTGPFLRYELIEDRFDRTLNRNLIGRPEFFALGLNATAQLGWAGTSFGSTRDTLLYSGRLSKGFDWGEGQLIMASTQLSGEYASGRIAHQRFGLQAQYYRPLSGHRLLYVAGAIDSLRGPSPDEWLPLGGDNGLRGYPLRYQTGEHRGLFTIEQRFYTDLYPWRLFRIGGAMFADAGRAWEGPAGNAANPGWLADAGVGLRIVSTRSAFSNVLHLDLAFPLNTAPELKRAQLQFKTKTSF